MHGETTRGDTWMSKAYADQVSQDTMQHTLVVLHEQLEQLSQENYRLKQKLEQAIQVKGHGLENPPNAQGAVEALQTQLNQASLKLKEAIDTINQQNGYITSLSERLERLQTLNDQKASQSLEPVSLTPEGTQTAMSVEAYYLQVKTAMQQAQQALEAQNFEGMVNALRPVVYLQGTAMIHPQAFPLAVVWYAKALGMRPSKDPTYTASMQEVTTLLGALVQQAPYMAFVLDFQELQAWQKQARKEPQQALEAFKKVFNQASLHRFAEVLETAKAAQTLQSSQALYAFITQLYPQDASAWHQVGVLSMKQQQEAQAITMFEHELTLPQSNPKTHYYLGMLYARKAIAARKQAPSSLTPTVLQSIQQDILQALGHLEKVAPAPKASGTSSRQPSVVLSQQEQQQLTYWLAQLKALK